ncbi:MAG TPA: ribbon-helix-helix protein, CopG family [Acidimicrobiales bacterium]|nr:ribbon-helix-helix protein, CopG family [Acidimicrobiales bacterium]
MRTTVAVDDNLLAAAKELAASRGVSLGRVFEDGLRALLGRRREDERPEIPVVHGRGGVRPGVDVTSNRALTEVLDEGTALEQLR